MDRSLFVFVNPFHARHVRENGTSFVRAPEESVVCIGLRCPESPGRQEGRSYPGRSVPSASRPAQPRSAPPCADPPRPARGISGFTIFQYALHKKGLQKQICVDTLLSSQERRVAVVPRRCRSSTARCVPPSVCMGLRLFVLPKRCSGWLAALPWGQEGRLYPGRSDPSASRPAPPPRCAPPRPDPPVVCPGF